MGRMWEAFREVERQRSPAAEPAGRVSGRDPVPELLDDGDEEVHFIEVGGPRKIIAASPAVLAAVPQPAPSLKIARTSEPDRTPRLRRMDHPPEVEDAPRGAAVSFRPVTPVTALAPNPGVGIATELVAYHNPEHPASRSYQALAEAIVGGLPTGLPQVLLFTSAAPQTGTTTVLLNLAITLARAGRQRVAVLDANHHAPAIAERLGLPGCPGLGEVLSGTAVVEEALHELEPCRLWVVPGGRDLDRRPVAALSNVLRQMRTLFHLVLVDAPEWEGRPEAAGLSALCDALYLVLRRDDADSSQIDDLVETLRRRSGRLRGCIVPQR